MSERGQEDADTVAAEHWRYATVMLSLSPTAAPPSASLLSESAKKVPGTTTGLLLRKALPFSATNMFNQHSSEGR